MDQNRKKFEEVNFQEITISLVNTTINIPQKICRFITKNGKINLNQYVKIVIDNYRELILNNRRELGFKSEQLRFNNACIRSEDIERLGKKIEDIASKRGRSKYLWFGLVYLIIDINSAQSYGGMTTLTLDDRWHFTVRSALTKPETWHYPLIKLIREHLLEFVEQDLKINEDWDWKKIHAILDKKFKRNVKIICFDDESLRLEEKKFISENNLTNDGLNRLEGGEGGPAIALPMITIAIYIALGFTITDIYQALIKNYNIKCTLQTVRARILDYWDNFNNAQVLFLRPMLEMLIKARFEIYEINEAYDRFMNERIELFFGGNSYRKLQKIIDKDWSNLQISNHIPLWTNQGKIRRVIPIEALKYLIRHYLYAIDAVNDEKVKALLSFYTPDVRRQNIVYQIQNQLGYDDWNEARQFIAIPYLIEQLRKGIISPTEVYISIGYKEISAHTHNTLSKGIFDGLNTEEVQIILNKNQSIRTLDDFLNFINSIRKKRFSISKEIIDELLFKYITSKDAIKDLSGYFSGDFLKEVQKYYSNYKKAKWIVKAPFIIKELRKLPKIYSSEDLKKIFSTIGYKNASTNNYGVIFRDMFFGMGVLETIHLIKSNPNINKYEDFEQIFKDKYGSDAFKSKIVRKSSKNKNDI